MLRRAFVGPFHRGSGAQAVAAWPPTGRGCVRHRTELAGAVAQTAIWPYREKVNVMLYTIAVVLLILWVLGLVSSYTMGGFIHILVVVAVVMVLVNVIGGRRGG